MAKKFWEREDFDIALFTSVFYGIYNVYYESGDDGPMYRTMVTMGDDLLKDSEAKPFITMFANYRQDMVTSDREAASLAAAYEIYRKHYKEVEE